MSLDETTQTPPRIDEVQIERWTRGILAGKIDDIRSSFAAHRAHGPEVAWSPADDAKLPPQIEFLNGYWRRLARGRPAPEIHDIDALDMRPALGFIVLLDVLDDGADFRCRLFGTAAAAVSGFDMTGKLASEHPASSYIVSFFMATYRAAYRRPEPLYTVHRPPLTIHTNAWHRLLLPLTDREGRVVRFLSGNVPLRSTGKPVLLRL